VLSSLKGAVGDDPAWSSNRQENAVGPSPSLEETAKETIYVYVYIYICIDVYIYMYRCIGIHVYV
jgi:hypothetical protein